MATGGPTTARIVAAILLPPLGVFLARGLGVSFWISVVLTLIGWLPGALFALVAVLKPDLPLGDRPRISPSPRAPDPLR